MGLHPDQERMKRWLFGPVVKISEDFVFNADRTRRFEKMGPYYTSTVDQFALAEALAAAEKRGEIIMLGKW